MKTILLLLLLVQTPLLFAQIKCKTVKQEDGSKVTTCFHQNGKVSIVETWDRYDRYGSLKGYNTQGKEICMYNLRHVGGHASVLLKWYESGQLRSVSYSDAPDGGIQYYHSTREFDESGNQVSFTEDSYDDKPSVPTREIPVQDTAKPRKPLVEINRVLDKQ